MSWVSRVLGFQIEVLLAGELEIALENVGRLREGGLRIALGDLGLDAVEAVGRDRVLDGDQRIQRFVLHAHRPGPGFGSFQVFAQDPRHRLPEEHHLVHRQQRLVVLGALVIDSGNICRGNHPDDSGHLKRRTGIQAQDFSMGAGGLHRVGVQDPGQTRSQVVGIQRGAGDVRGRRFVAVALADYRCVGALG